MKVALFERIKTIIEEMTINEGAKELQEEKNVQKAVKAVIAAQTRNLDKLAINVSNNQAISKDEKDETKGSFVPKGKVDESKAGKTAVEKAKAKQGKAQEMEQNEIEK